MANLASINKKNSPEPVTHIEAFGSGELHIRPFLNECIENLLEKPHVKTNKYPIELIVQQEEEELVALQDATSPSYLRLQDTLQNAGKLANCNVFAYIGHTEICARELTGSRLLPKKPKNSLPTAVFIIACHSYETAASLNEDAELRSQGFFFFGFQPLMHVIAGDIFLCEESHTEMPDMDCRFPNQESNLNVIHNGNAQNWKHNAILDQFQKPYGEKIKTMKCCVAKYERFRQIFIDNLSERECAQFTAEAIAKKCRFIRDNEGALVDMDRFLNSENGIKPFMVYLEDAKRCTKEEPCKPPTKNLSPFLRNANVFNQESKLYRVLQEVYRIIYSRYERVANEKKDLRIVQLLQPLSKEDRVFLLHYRPKLADYYLDTSVPGPLFFELFQSKYKFCIRDCLKRNEVNWEERNDDGESLPLLLTKNFIAQAHSPNPSYTQKELVRLFIDLKKIVPENIFWNHSINIEFPLSVLLVSPILYKGLFTFFLLQFDSKWFHERSDMLLNTILISLYHTSSQKLELLEYLFFKGVRSDKINTIQLYEDNEMKVLSADVLELLYSYAFNQRDFPDYTPAKRLIYYQSKAALSSSEIAQEKKILRMKFDKEIRNLLQYNNNDSSHSINEITEEKLAKIQKRKEHVDMLRTFYENAVDAYEETVNFLRANPVFRVNERILQRKLEANSAEFTEGAKAMEEIKTFFSTVQKNIKKKKNVPQPIREKLLTNLRRIYDSALPTENEGNSAARRLEEMQSVYQSFLNSQNPTVENQWGGKMTRRLKRRNRKTRKH